VDPRSVSELGQALERMLAAPDQRANLARRGAEAARSYRWEASARQSLDFFRRVAG
jgi:glycosyltransferase involved in cell wall biosynthesis